MPEPALLYVIGKFAEAVGTRVGEAFAQNILGLQTAEMEMLSSLQENVDQLIGGPRHTGLYMLQSALRAHRDSHDRLVLLRDARSSFMQALGQEGHPLYRSMTYLSLAIVWIALNSKEDVPKCLADAHVEAARSAVTYKKSGRFSRRHTTPDWNHLRNHLDYMNKISQARLEWGSCEYAAPLFYSVVFSEPINTENRKPQTFTVNHNLPEDIKNFIKAPYYECDPKSRWRNRPSYAQSNNTQTSNELTDPPPDKCIAHLIAKYLPRS